MLEERMMANREGPVLWPFYVLLTHTLDFMRVYELFQVVQYTIHVKGEEWFLTCFCLLKLCAEHIPFKVILFWMCQLKTGKWAWHWQEKQKKIDFLYFTAADRNLKAEAKTTAWCFLCVSVLCRCDCGRRPVRWAGTRAAAWRPRSCQNQ